MVVENRINFCQPFGRGLCPFQKAMEIVYLVPQVLDPDSLLKYQRICLECLQDSQIQRKHPRVPVSFLVHCRQDDQTEVGGRAYNLSKGGLGLRSNCPLHTREYLSMECLLPKQLDPVKLTGEVVWCKHHYDTAEEEEALFSAGIKFLNLTEPNWTLIWESVVGSRT